MTGNTFVRMHGSELSFRTVHPIESPAAAGLSGMFVINKVIKLGSK
jgi:hypothetical protein